VIVRTILAGLLSASLAAPQRGGVGDQAPGGQTAQAQQITDPKQLCTLEGRVFHAQTGEPVPRVTVTLTGGAGGRGGGGGGMRVARTDEQGRFVIERVPPGSYRLAAERVGFLRQFYGAQSPGGAGAPINLSPGQTVRNLDIRLTPQGVILGSVLDEYGDPVPRATVAAYRAGQQRVSLGVGRAGGAAGQTAATAMTNDIGEYRLAGLTPGQYFVVATAQIARGGRGAFDPAFGGPGRGMAAVSAPAEEDILPTYYPSTLDANSAVPVAVSPGQETGGVTIVLRRGNLFRVQGRVAGAAPDQAAGIRVMLTPRGGLGQYLLGAARAAQVRQDGTFELVRVAPGSYYLIAQSLGRGGGGRGGPQAEGGGAVGRAAVDVANGDVRDVVVTLVEPLTVSGTLRVEGQPTAAAQAPTLSLIPLERIPGLPVGTAAARVAQGAFKMTGVTPDVYYLAAGGLPEGAYLKSVRLNNQEVIEKGIDLTSARGSALLDVTVSLKGAAIEGTVVRGGEAAPGSWVLLVSDPIRPSQPYLNRSAWADQEGKFDIRGLAPGAYKLYAFAEAQPEISADLERVKALEAHAVSVRLTEGQTETVAVRVIPAEAANP